MRNMKVLNGLLLIDLRHIQKAHNAPSGCAALLANVSPTIRQWIAITRISAACHLCPFCES